MENTNNPLTALFKFLTALLKKLEAKDIIILALIIADLLEIFYT